MFAEMRLGVTGRSDVLGPSKIKFGLSEVSALALENFSRRMCKMQFYQQHPEMSDVIEKVG